MINSHHTNSVMLYSVNKKNRFVKNFTIDNNDKGNNNDNKIVFLFNDNALQKTIPTALGSFVKNKVIFV